MRPRPPAVSPALRGLLFAMVAASFCAFMGCESAYPEVVVVNKLGEEIMVKDVSFSGCLWTGVLAYEETTSPGRCMPGEDRVHFKKFDVAAVCDDLDEELDGGVDEEEEDAGTVLNWFNYQTLSTRRVNYGDFVVVELTPGDLEQDFSVPGPYGH